MTFETGRMVSQRKIIPVLLLLVAALAVIAPREALAHPNGQFQHQPLRRHQRRAGLRRGELPHRYGGDSHLPGDAGYSGIVAKEGDPGVAAYLEKKAELLAGGLALQVNGQPLLLQLDFTERHLPLPAPAVCRP
jgi:hypothetical protein